MESREGSTNGRGVPLTRRPPAQLSDRGAEAPAPQRQTLLALDSLDAKSIAKKKEQEKPKGFTVWVGGFPDNCVDDHKLFQAEMEKGAQSLTVTPFVAPTPLV